MHLDRGAALSSGLHPSTIQSVLARMADVPLGALGVTLAPRLPWKPLHSSLRAAA